MAKLLGKLDSGEIDRLMAQAIIEGKFRIITDASASVPLDPASPPDHVGGYRENAAAPKTSTQEGFVMPATAQAFWQGVWDELLGIGKIVVQPLPNLTPKQLESLDKYGFLLVRIPAIIEEQYPSSFVKPAWGRHPNIQSIERFPLVGDWIVVETIAKPHYDDPNGYPDDRLMATLMRSSRFNTSHDDLTGGLLAKIAKITGFPKKGTRLPTVEEWNFIGNLFNWLRENRGMNLPDLGSTRSWEWCQNTLDSDYRLIVGYSENGGLADVHDAWRGARYGDISFRVLAVL
ncbi:hypothetical protein KKF59_03565 [Patescibacteria group bacterium]|nr:hypothetical protein [Patescibacteria group bacterium]